jgi:photosystem II stability/assembly factor-like uncharacterized protein
MLNENFGFVGGCPKIDSFIYESGYDVRVGGINYDTLLFQTDDEPLVYYHLIRTVPALPESCLYKTENGGLDWMSVHTPFISGIVDFMFINESVGFVLTLKEGVYKTENGGLDWLKIFPEAFTTGYGVTYQNPFDAIGVQSTNHIYLLDREQDLIIESINGGNSWQCISKGTPQLAYTFYVPEECYFKIDSDTGYIRTSKGLHRTFDKGKSWEHIQVDLMINDLAIEDSKLYLASFYNLYESNDFGGSITRLDLAASLEADKFVVFDDSLVFFTDKSIFNHPNMVKTMDWGKTKQMMTREREDNMMDFCFVSRNTGYLVGDNGMVLKYSSK